MTDRPARPSALALAAFGCPGVLLAVLFGLSGAGTIVAERSPVLAPANSSLAEAAGNRDASEVVWRIANGERLTERAVVRIPLKIVGTAYLSPLEAAVLSEWTPMMQLLIDADAPAEGPGLQQLRCIAERERDRDTIRFMTALDAERALDCRGVELPAYIRRP